MYKNIEGGLKINTPSHHRAGLYIFPGGNFRKNKSVFRQHLNEPIIFKVLSTRHKSPLNYIFLRHNVDSPFFGYYRFF
jgi:hypothetical protein